MASVDGRIGFGVTALAIVSMAVDHLMGDDPGLEDPPTFLIASGLSLALAAIVFLHVIPRAKAAAAPAERAARDGLICSALAVVPGIATLWLGLPFILAGGGIALGLSARREEPSRRAIAAIVIGTLVLIAAAGAYLVQAIDKLA
jgi:small neutral amino acid transporter SnatA (MarC family)